MKLSLMHPSTKNSPAHTSTVKVSMKRVDIWERPPWIFNIFQYFPSCLFIFFKFFSFGDRQMIASLLRKLQYQSKEQLKQRKPEMINSLKKLGKCFFQNTEILLYFINISLLRFFFKFRWFCCWPKMGFHLLAPPGVKNSPIRYLQNFQERSLHQTGYHSCGFYRLIYLQIIYLFL